MDRAQLWFEVRILLPRSTVVGEQHKADTHEAPYNLLEHNVQRLMRSGLGSAAHAEVAQVAVASVTGDGVWATQEERRKRAEGGL